MIGVENVMNNFNILTFIRRIISSHFAKNIPNI